MADTTGADIKRDRDIFYYRRRLKNRIFARLASFFAEEAARTGVTKRDIARRLKKDPAQISRWLSGPSNLTLESLSDLLLALDAEADPPQIVRFKDRALLNSAHSLIEKIDRDKATATSQQAVKVLPYNTMETDNSPSSGSSLRKTIRSANVYHEAC